MAKHWLLIILLGISLTCFYSLLRLEHNSKPDEQPTGNQSSSSAPIVKTVTPRPTPSSGELETRLKDTTNADELYRKNRLAVAEMAQNMLKDEVLDAWVIRAQKLFEPLYAEWQTDEATIQKIGIVLRNSQVMNKTAYSNTTLTGREQNEYLSAVRSQTVTELSQIIGNQKAEQMMKFDEDRRQKNLESARKQFKRDDE
jgi:hypothetical protein